ncbi:MAG: hypothetical protein DBY20_07865 [Coriobacteriia bacterium]|nr:MAG: hypothetical protein DBY20_07865 [Coriobacteriia bacterium]
MSMFGQTEENGYVLVEHKPEWVGDNQEDIGPETLKKLVDFYITHPPFAKSSCQERLIDYYGWDNPWNPPTSLGERLTRVCDNENPIYKADKQEEMQDKLEKAGLLRCVDLPEQETACMWDSKRNQMLSLFYHIRNSLCHGRYVVLIRGGDLWIAAEDMAPRKQNGEKEKRLTARMVLRVDTLLKWVDIITAGPEEINRS